MLKLVTGPTVEPVTLAEAKAHLRVEVADDDALISRLIAAARQMAETRLRRALVNQTWDLVLDRWPPLRLADSGRVYQTLNMPWAAASTIEVTNPALVSVTSITYLDPAGGTQTVNSGDYVVLAGTPGLIFPAVGKSWPAVQSRPGVITVRYVAGFGADATTVPECVKTWILMHLGSWYENREAVSVIQGGVALIIPGVDALLAPADWGAYH
jgi:uncharacterized phiE125 gp8 family phage protein